MTPFFYMAQKWKDGGALVCVMYVRYYIVGKIVGMIFEQLYVFVKNFEIYLDCLMID